MADIHFLVQDGYVPPLHAPTLLAIRDDAQIATAIEEMAQILDLPQREAYDLHYPNNHVYTYSLRRAEARQLLPRYESIGHADILRGDLLIVEPTFPFPLIADEILAIDGNDGSGDPKAVVIARRRMERLAPYLPAFIGLARNLEQDKQSPQHITLDSLLLKNIGTPTLYLTNTPPPLDDRFVSPEERNGVRLANLPDVLAAATYSFGATLCYVLTGDVPQLTPHTTYRAVEEYLESFPALPARVRTHLCRALQPQPQERFASPTAFLTALSNDPQ